MSPLRECLPLVLSRHIEEVANNWQTAGTRGQKASMSTDEEASHDIDKQYKGEDVEKIRSS